MNFQSLSTTVTFLQLLSLMDQLAQEERSGRLKISLARLRSQVQESAAFLVLCPLQACPVERQASLATLRQAHIDWLGATKRELIHACAPVHWPFVVARLGNPVTRAMGAARLTITHDENGAHRLLSRLILVIESCLNRELSRSAQAWAPMCAVDQANYEGNVKGLVLKYLASVVRNSKKHWLQLFSGLPAIQPSSFYAMVASAYAHYSSHPGQGLLSSRIDTLTTDSSASLEETLEPSLSITRVQLDMTQVLAIPMVRELYEQAQDLRTPLSWSNSLALEFAQNKHLVSPADLERLCQMLEVARYRQEKAYDDIFDKVKKSMRCAPNQDAHVLARAAVIKFAHRLREFVSAEAHHKKDIETIWRTAKAAYVNLD